MIDNILENIYADTLSLKILDAWATAFGNYLSSWRLALTK